MTPPNDSCPHKKPASSPPDIDAILADLWLPMRTYAVSLVGSNPHAVAEILQESAIHIWEHKSELPEIKNLRSWAFRIVHFKALSYRRNISENLLVGFSEEAIEYLAGIVETADETLEQRRKILVDCIGKLADRDRRLLTRYYDECYSIKKIAGAMKKNDETVYKRISRVRRALRRCVEQTLAAADATKAHA